MSSIRLVFLNASDAYPVTVSSSVEKIKRNVIYSGPTCSTESNLG